MYNIERLIELSIKYVHTPLIKGSYLHNIPYISLERILGINNVIIDYTHLYNIDCFLRDIFVIYSVYYGINIGVKLSKKTDIGIIINCIYYTSYTVDHNFIPYTVYQNIINVCNAIAPNIQDILSNTLGYYYTMLNYDSSSYTNIYNNISNNSNIELKANNNNLSLIYYLLDNMDNARFIQFVKANTRFIYNINYKLFINNDIHYQNHDISLPDISNHNNNRQSLLFQKLIYCLEYKVYIPYTDLLYNCPYYRKNNQLNLIEYNIEVHKLQHKYHLN